MTDPPSAEGRVAGAGSDGAARARVTVVMPTFLHEAFIRRAVESLRGQTMAAWRLVVVDDGSPDDTGVVVAPYLRDPRVGYVQLPRNEGLGRALNVGLDLADTELVAYLPSDDVYHPGHLAGLVAALDRNPEAALAVSGVRHHYNKTAEAAPPGEAPQLVQCMHRRTADRWAERAELVTDDLDRMLWDRLRERGGVVETGEVTCEWVDHPGQLHKLLREPLGGVNAYRSAFGVARPLRFHTTVGNPIDEVGRYRAMRERPDTPRAADGLKIVLCGELAYNAERVLALEERGHTLYGLWMPEPQSLNLVGPVPFGHVEDLPRDDWVGALERIRPDVIYGLLNWQAVPFAHEVLRRRPASIPFVWHFKEGPFICIEKGTWPQLLDLTLRSSGAIFSSPELADWFATTLPELGERPTMVLDGDLPKRDWFEGPRSPLLSDTAGEVHTVVAGRPIGLHPETVQELAAEGVHLHFYGTFLHGQWRGWIERTNALAPGYLHLHDSVDQEGWVGELSRYDAAWLHAFPSQNGGELSRANWDDLNYPARIATYAVAGLPMIQADNAGAIVATQALCDGRGLGVTFTSIPHLAEQLRDRTRMAKIRGQVWAQRDDFTFDAHADRLVAFFREAAADHPG